MTGFEQDKANKLDRLMPLRIAGKTETVWW